MNLLDKIIGYIDPVRGLKRQTARTLALTGGGAYTGSSQTKRSLKNWHTSSNEADAEILPDLAILRERTRDLYKNNLVAGGAIETNLTNIIGPGLKLQSNIDNEYLGLTDEQAEEWESKTEREFRIWCESKECDAARTLNFYEQQELAFLSELISGEVFCLLPIIKRPNVIYDLRVQLVEADRVCNPNDMFDSDRVAGGIEIGTYGEPIAYHIQVNPIGLYNYTKKWQRVTAYGSKSGRSNVIHLFRKQRPGQRRGVSILAPVIEPLRQLGRYTDAELMAAVVSSMFTVFVKNDNGVVPETGLLGDLNTGGSAKQQIERAMDLNLAPGAIMALEPNESVEVANPGRPNSQFDPFTIAILRQVGMRLELPYEILVKHFQSSYSAARGAILEAWKMFKTRRQKFALRFCQPIYLEWLTEAVAKGIIIAPKFLEDERARFAWAGAEWVGPAQGQIDPTKETTAAELRVSSGFSTRAQEAAAMGNDFQRVIRKRKAEEILMRDAQIGLTPNPNPDSGQLPDANTTQDTNQ